LEISAVLLQLRLEAREQRERVGGGSGKAGENPIVVEAPDLLGGLLDDGLTEGDLAVAGHHRAVAMADGEDGCAVKRHRFGVYRPLQKSVKKTGRLLSRGDSVRTLSTCKTKNLAAY